MPALLVWDGRRDRDTNALTSCEVYELEPSLPAASVPAQAESR